MYSAERMNLLKQTLINSTEVGKPQDYEIRVDDMKVVPRTNDVDQFDNHEDFVLDETKKVIVLIYDGASRRNTRHTFHFKDERKPNAKDENVLNGTEVEKLVTDTLEQKERQWKYDLLEKENAQLRQEVKEADEAYDKALQVIEELKGKRKLEDVQWGELLGIAGEAILRRNTHMLAKVPGMQGLAGFIEQDNQSQEKQLPEPEPEPEAKATFAKAKPKGESGEEGMKDDAVKSTAISEEEKNRLDFLRHLQDRLNAEELQRVVALLSLLIKYPRSIEPAIVYVIECNQRKITEEPGGQQKSATEKANTRTDGSINEEKPPSEKSAAEKPNANIKDEGAINEHNFDHIPSSM